VLAGILVKRKVSNFSVCGEFTNQAGQQDNQFTI